MNATDRESPVLAALYRGDDETARLLAKDRVLDLPEAAALGDSVRAARIVEDDRAALQVRTSDGWTPLHLAAFFGHAEVARILLAAGADIESVSSNGIANRPLHAALAGKLDPAVVDLLLSRGANAKATAEAGVTPLHLAAARGSMTYTRRLLEMNVDPVARMTDGKLPATFAAERGHPEVVALIEDWAARSSSISP
jgi:ankyrin repeat protein